MFDYYLPVVIAALSVLILGCWNPRALQTTQNGQPTGNPNYMWLALISLLVGLLAVFLTIPHGKRGRGMSASASPEYF